MYGSGGGGEKNVFNIVLCLNFALHLLSQI